MNKIILYINLSECGKVLLFQIIQKNLKKIWSE